MGRRVKRRSWPVSSTERRFSRPVSQPRWMAAAASAHFFPVPTPLWTSSTTVPSPSGRRATRTRVGAGSPLPCQVKEIRSSGHDLGEVAGGVVAGAPPQVQAPVLARDRHGGIAQPLPQGGGVGESVEHRGGGGRDALLQGEGGARHRYPPAGLVRARSAPPGRCHPMRGPDAAPGAGHWGPRCGGGPARPAPREWPHAPLRHPRSAPRGGPDRPAGRGSGRADHSGGHDHHDGSGRRRGAGPPPGSWS